MFLLNQYFSLFPPSSLKSIYISFGEDYKKKTFGHLYALFGECLFRPFAYFLIGFFSDVEFYKFFINFGY